MILKIFTDGACKGNPGIGGWGALLVYGDKQKTIKGAVANTTNNIMELTAVIKALEIIKKPSEILIILDSSYVRLGITEWIHTWQKNNWRTANKAPVKNKELWQQLLELTQQHKIQWQWVKGHSGHIENELVDGLANEAIIELQNQQ